MISLNRTLTLKGLPFMRRRCNIEAPRQCSVRCSDAVGLYLGRVIGENPRPRLLDRQDIVACDLELDLHGEPFAVLDTVQLREPLMDRGKMPAQLSKLIVGH